MNMKKLLMTATMITAISVSAAALAAKPEGMVAKEGGKAQEMTFDQRKSKTLERMNQRITLMQKKRDCVQASATQEAMQACFPHAKERMEKMKKEKMKNTKGNKGGKGAPEVDDDGEE